MGFYEDRAKPEVTMMNTTTWISRVYFKVSNYNPHLLKTSYEFMATAVGKWIQIQSLIIIHITNGAFFSLSPSTWPHILNTIFKTLLLTVLINLFEVTNKYKKKARILYSFQQSYYSYWPKVKKAHSKYEIW